MGELFVIVSPTKLRSSDKIKNLAISASQCRAARGLLGWSQSDLACQAGLSKTSIVKFEQSFAEARTDTVKVIKGAFLRFGVEFLLPNGVNLNLEQCRVFASKQAIQHDWPKFLKSLREQGHEKLTIYNWADFGNEFKICTSSKVQVVLAESQSRDRAAEFGNWLILPLLETPYRIAVRDGLALNENPSD